MHKSLEKLYAGIEEAGTGRSGVGELTALAALSANLYTLVSVAPWLDEHYGTTRQLDGKIREVAAALVDRLEWEQDDVARVRMVNALFGLSTLAADFEPKVLEYAESILAQFSAGYTGPDPIRYEAEACRLASICFCLVQDAALAAMSRSVVARWAAEAAADGTWTNLPEESAEARVLAAAAYEDYTGDESFSSLVRRNGGQKRDNDAGNNDPEQAVRCMNARVEQILRSMQAGPDALDEDLKPEE